MRALVTGAAGFIGSAVAERLLREGHSVIGIDNYLDSYPRPVKEHRAARLAGFAGFSLIENDIHELDLAEVTDGIDCVFHLAAQAGVRASWGRRFEIYTECNILSTQRLLEAVKQTGVDRFVYSSSSSIYGNTDVLPTPETVPPAPVSPYAVSKLAGEHLCALYLANFGIPTVALRYFTVYGPRPRPDQAVCLFTRALMDERPITVFGDGQQLRGMTYVEDVVDANLLAASGECVGETMNIGGGTSITVLELIAHLEQLTGKAASIQHVDPAKGDARHTLADNSRAQQLLGWSSATELGDGLAASVQSILEFYYS